jgi:hypothetical protein
MNVRTPLEQVKPVQIDEDQKANVAMSQKSVRAGKWG